MSKAIQPEHLAELRSLEARLKVAAIRGDVASLDAVMIEIKQLMKPYGSHHRILECKLWYSEGLLNANSVAVAESGFEEIRQRARKTTLLYTEATFLLALCNLRQKRIIRSKELFQEVFHELAKEQLTETRQFLQKRVLERMDEESILSQLIGTEEGILRVETIHCEAIKLIREGKSESELFDMLARALPYGTSQLILNLRTDALLQIAYSDRKLLPAPGQAAQPINLGKRVIEVMKRIGWKTLCDANSPIFKLWSARIPKVYSSNYFTGAIVQSLNNWKIGVPMLAIGFSAVIMKYSAQEFCEATKPGLIMATRRKKEPKQ